MRSRLNRRRHREGKVEELNITAFMNLMVVLVPFLLITAVFTRITILELNLPAPNGVETNDRPKLELEVVVRADAVVVQDRRRGVLKTLPVTDGSYDTGALSSYLRDVKAQFPDVLNASILMARDIPYETLVLMMDTVRMADVQQDDDTRVRMELFPEISIGDAPRLRPGQKVAAREVQ